MGRWSIEELAARMDEGVIQRLDHYVYRLIDPRNGETFYVGVGKWKRVLDHVRGVLEQGAKVGDALRGGISWRCRDAVNSQLRKGYATWKRLPLPTFPIHRDFHLTR